MGIVEDHSASEPNFWLFQVTDQPVVGIRPNLPASPQSCDVNCSTAAREDPDQPHKVVGVASGNSSQSSSPR